MTNLLHLNLSNNKMKEIPYGIVRLIDLETCDLRRNNLEILPDMHEFEGLAELYLDYNSFEYLHPSIGVLTDLEFLVRKFRMSRLSFCAAISSNPLM